MLDAYIYDGARTPFGRHAGSLSKVRPDGNFDRALRIARRLDLNLDRWVGFMSTGMRQKLALAACLSIDAPLYVMDEPTANLDPTVRG